MDPKDRAVFTTGEAAKLCNVTIGTVIRWFDAGELKGYKIPGSRDRRIPRGELIAFMKRHGLPLGELEAGSDGPRRKRLLIVDDEPAIVAILWEVLTEEGYRVETVGNGALALEWLDREPFDLVVTDIRMPVLDGRSLYRAVGELRWFAWDAAEPPTGWRLHLAVEHPASGTASRYWPSNRRPASPILG